MILIWFFKHLYISNMNISKHFYFILSLLRCTVWYWRSLDDDTEKHMLSVDEGEGLWESGDSI